MTKTHEVHAIIDGGKHTVTVTKDYRWLCSCGRKMVKPSKGEGAAILHGLNHLTEAHDVARIDANVVRTNETR